MHNHEGEECPVHVSKACPDTVEEAVRLPAKTGNIIAYISSTGEVRYYILKNVLPTDQLNQLNLKYNYQIDKVYPGAKSTKLPRVSDYVPGQPLLHSCRRSSMD